MPSSFKYFHRVYLGKQVDLNITRGSSAFYALNRYTRQHYFKLDVPYYVADPWEVFHLRELRDKTYYYSFMTMCKNDFCYGLSVTGPTHYNYPEHREYRNVLVYSYDGYTRSCTLEEFLEYFPLPT